MIFCVVAIVFHSVFVFHSHGYTFIEQLFGQWSSDLLPVLLDSCHKPFFRIQFSVVVIVFSCSLCVSLLWLLLILLLIVFVMVFRFMLLFFISLF